MTIPDPATIACCFFTSVFYPAKLHLFIRVWLIILNCLEFFNFCNKFFGGLKRWYVVFRYMYCDILFYVSSDFSSSFFCDKTAETTDVNILSFRKGILYFLKHGLQRNQDVYLRYTCFIRNLINEVCLSHGGLFYKFLILNI